MKHELPILKTDQPQIDQAFALALEDLTSNIAPFQDGLLAQPAPVILAGKGYDTPWTRDTAINVWNGAGLILPEESKNTLLSVLQQDASGVRIGGQYWDAVIWAIGAWNYWLYTGDAEFYALSREAVVNSLRYFEETEYDPEKGLFRGPACYGDGIAAYPDRYAAGESGILYFPTAYPERCAKKGVGIPMFALSTNCLYAEAYRVAFRMTGDKAYAEKAERMKQTINDAFWNEKRGQYDYLLDAEGRCESQEALGISFALLFGIAEGERAAQVVKNAVVTPQGIACVDPSFERYRSLGYGRHSGTVWPHAQAFWATAAARYDPARFEYELLHLTRNALRDGQFAEIYHPETGLPYGGVQESHGVMDPNWVSQPRQTWSATGYLRMILSGLCGVAFEENGVRVSPLQTQSVHELELSGLAWRGREIHLKINDFTASRFIPIQDEKQLDIRL